MYGIPNDERIATQPKMHQGEEAGIAINSKIQQSQISNHKGALGFDSVDL
jgi:hypothetical protein